MLARAALTQRTASRVPEPEAQKERPAGTKEPLCVSSCVSPPFVFISPCDSRVEPLNKGVLRIQNACPLEAGAGPPIREPNGNAALVVSAGLFRVRLLSTAIVMSSVRYCQ
jgi:hypothetical protein